MRARVNLTIGFVSFAFMLIVALLWSSTADAALPRKQEAETGPTQTAGAPHTDSASTPTSASPNSYRFTANGGIRFFFTVGTGEQVTSVVVRAKLGGTSTSDSDLMAVANGTNLGTKNLTLASNTSYSEQSFAVSPSLGAGSHTIDIYAQDMQSGDKQIWDWVELRGTNSNPSDTTPPSTSITSGPTNGSTDTDGSVSFGFSSSESNSTFECKLDESAYGSCTTPKSYSSLENGDHTFSVRATDAAGNTDATPATRTFSVAVPDTTMPDSVIDSGPGDTSDGAATFEFSANEPSTFECKLIVAGTSPEQVVQNWTSCTSGKTYSGLADGSYTFRLRATDTANNVESPVTGKTFTVTNGTTDTTPPNTTIDSGPAEGSTDTDGSVTFTFSSSETGSTFECKLDSAAYASCTSPKSYSDLADGSHTFAVRATDSANNVDASAASRTFNVDVPTVDSDNDGVPDSTDNCDQQPGPASNNGCPVAQTGCDVNVTPSQDLDAIVDGDSATTATKFCLSSGTYNISDDLDLRAGDHLAGPIAVMDSHGRADYAKPTAKINAAGASRVISGFDSIEVEWVEITGADGQIDANGTPAQCPSSPLPSGCPVTGTGVGISMGNADDSSELHHLYIHDNDASGVGNMHGRIKNFECHSNTNNSAFLGVVASCVKGVVEYEAAEGYVHDEQGNGVWLDHTLSGPANQAEMSTNPGGGAWFHELVSVDNGRKGLRHEFSPRDAPEGGTLPTPTIMIENNNVHGNNDEGISIRDAQNATVRNNVLGAVTIGGIAYSENGDNNNNGAGDGVLVSDSGRSDRTDTRNVTVTGNTLNGDEVRCPAPGAGITCQ
jgi:parallel beta-helix repeat protein